MKYRVGIKVATQRPIFMHPGPAEWFERVFVVEGITRDGNPNRFVAVNRAIVEASLEGWRVGECTFVTAVEL